MANQLIETGNFDKSIHTLMNGYDVKRLALILAIQAEIEGMKAENKYREINAHDLTYGDGDFEVKATELRNLAYYHDDQL